MHWLSRTTKCFLHTASSCGLSVWEWCAEHDALDPEYSILKQRLARRIRYEGMNDEDVQKMDLVQITKACTLSKPPTSPKVYWTESHVMLYIHLPSC